MTFEPSTGLCSITALKSYVTRGVKLYFNAGLYSFFENFNSIKYVGINEAGSTANIKIQIQDTKYNNIDISGYGSCYKMTQEYNSLYLWNTLKSFVIVSAMVPIVDEFTPAPSLSPVENKVVNSSISTSNSTMRILTDFEPLITTGSDARSVIQYSPRSEFRRIDMNSVGEISNIDVRIMWKDIFGALHDVYIPPYGSSATIKFLFEKKK